MITNKSLIFAHNFKTIIFMGNINFKNEKLQTLQDKLACNKFVLTDVSDAELQKRRIPVYSYLL